MAALRFVHIAGKKLKNLNTSTVFRELFSYQFLEATEVAVMNM